MGAVPILHALGLRTTQRSFLQLQDSSNIALSSNVIPSLSLLPHFLSERNIKSVCVREYRQQNKNQEQSAHRSPPSYSAEEHCPEPRRTLGEMDSWPRVVIKSWPVIRVDE